MLTKLVDYLAIDMILLHVSWCRTVLKSMEVYIHKWFSYLPRRVWLSFFVSFLLFVVFQGRPGVVSLQLGVGMVVEFHSFWFSAVLSSILASHRPPLRHLHDRRPRPRQSSPPQSQGRQRPIKCIIIHCTTEMKGMIVTQPTFCSTREVIQTKVMQSMHLNSKFWIFWANLERLWRIHVKQT